MQNKRRITQVGSLPHESIEAAVEFSLRHPIPFLPELTSRGEYMLEYIKTPGILSCLDLFKTHKFSRVKIQCIGPATLFLNGYEEGDAFEAIYKHISSIMDGLVAEEVILFLDEPQLGQATFGFDYRELWSALFNSFDVIPGVHVCNVVDYDQLFDSDVEIISFDASKYDIQALSTKYRNGKSIAWGIDKMQDLEKLDFQEEDFLTMPCGMSHRFYSVEDCEKGLDMLMKAYEILSP